MAAPPPPPPPPSSSFPYDYLFKVLIIGDASVGKVRPVYILSLQIAVSVKYQENPNSLFIS